ncbi:MAG: hypothetical protein ACXVO9_11775, partial [Bacteroidia bacterium]
MKNKDNNVSGDNGDEMDNFNQSDIKTEHTENSDESAENSGGKDKTTELELKVSELNDRYLRLYSEF